MDQDESGEVDRLVALGHSDFALERIREAGLQEKLPGFLGAVEFLKTHDASAIDALPEKEREAAKDSLARIQEKQREQSSSRTDQPPAEADGAPSHPDSPKVG